MKLSEIKLKPTDNVVLEFNEFKVNVKKYIPEYTKLFIVSQIKNIYFADSILSSNLNISNKELKNMLTTCLIIGNYTDIDVSDMDYIDICDSVVESGLYDEIINIIPKREIDYLNNMIDNAIEEKRFELIIENSIENQFKKFLTYINENMSEKKLINFIKKAKKELNGFKIENFDIIKDLAKNFGNIDTNSPEDLTKSIDKIVDVIKSKKG
jgi:hypothetical protein